MAAVMLVCGCSHKPQTLGDVKSEHVTIDDSVRVHYKIWNVFDKQEQWKLAYTAAARKRLMKWNLSCNSSIRLIRLSKSIGLP